MTDPPPQHAILLAAGSGQRMRPLTADRPKCMLPVGGLPMIDRALSALRSRGCQRITVVAGFRERTLLSHLARWAESLDIRTVTNPRYAVTNSMFSLFLALEAVDEATWVVEGDVVFDAAVLDLPAPQPISWFADSAEMGLGGVYLTRDASGLLRSVQVLDNPPDPMSGMLKSAGLLRLDTEGVLLLRRWLADAVDCDRVRDRYDLILRDQIGDPALGVLDIKGIRWFEADTPEELATAERMFASAAGGRHVDGYAF